MATFDSNVIDSPAKLGLYPMVTYGEVSFGTSSTLALNDVIRLCKIPANSRIVDFLAFVPDLDGGGTPALKLDLKDNQATAVTYVVNSTVGQAGGTVDFSAFSNASVGTTYSSEAELRFVVSTAAAGAPPAAGTLKFFVTFQAL
jgi:hypothetical protein